MLRRQSNFAMIPLSLSGPHPPQTETEKISQELLQELLQILPLKLSLEILQILPQELSQEMSYRKYLLPEHHE